MRRFWAMFGFCSQLAWAGEPAPEAFDGRTVDFAAHLDDDAAFGRARLAMSFGDYAVAREILQPIAERNPSAAVYTNLGLSWMGSYYARYGLSAAAFARMQGVAVDPEGALAQGSPLARDEIAPALARGFAVADKLPGPVRGGSAVPVELGYAIDALATAQKLAPSDPTTRLHAFMAAAELTRWKKPSAEYATEQQAILKDAAAWPAELQALAYVDLGVARYLGGGKDAATEAYALFQRAETLGSPLGAYNRALLLACDPAFAASRDGAIPLFEALADGSGSPERARRAGLLPTATAWPFGAGAVELSTSAAEVADVVAAIEKPAAGDAVASVTLPNGSTALVKPGVAAWIVLPSGPAERRTREAASSVPSEPDAVVDAVLIQPHAERVVVRLQQACLDQDTFAPKVPGHEGCPLLMEVRLPE